MKYTPVYEKARKKTKNAPMETTTATKCCKYQKSVVCKCFFFDSHLWPICVLLLKPLYNNKRKNSATQILANNSTPLCYSKKLGIQLLFGYKYWAESGVITRLELYSNWDFKIWLLQILGKKGNYTSQYSCMNDDIRASLNRAGIRASTEHDFGFSISSFNSI